MCTDMTNSSLGKYNVLVCIRYDKLFFGKIGCISFWLCFLICKFLAAARICCEAEGIGGQEMYRCRHQGSKIKDDD